MSDAVLTFGLVGAFAALVTAHLATVFGLAWRQHRAQALGALVLPPLAPYWAFTGGMRVRAIVWIVCAALYVAALLLARR
jgi:hypothetical protein